MFDSEYLFKEIKKAGHYRLTNEAVQIIYDIYVENNHPATEYEPAVFMTLEEAIKKYKSDKKQMDKNKRDRQKRYRKERGF